MNTYRRYQDARDMAWRALLQVECKRLPIDVIALAKAQGMDIHPFLPDGEQPKLEQLLRAAGEGNCKSLRIRGKWHIFYDPRKLSENGVRFAVAHELGHFFLGHETKILVPGVRTYLSPENEGDLLDDPREMDDYAADIFAIRLLAPACLLHQLHVDSLGGIMNLCGMPKKAAALRAERMELLNQRDAFFTHPLERQVRDRFLPFLNEKKCPKPEETESTAEAESDLPPWQEEKAEAEEKQMLLIPTLPEGKRKNTGKRLRIPQRAWRWILLLFIFFLSFLIWYARNMQ